MSQLHSQGDLGTERSADEASCEPSSGNAHAAAELVRARRMVTFQKRRKPRAPRTENETLKLQVQRQEIELAQQREAITYLYKQLAAAPAAPTPQQLFAHLGTLDPTKLEPAKFTAEMMAELASDDE